MSVFEASAPGEPTPEMAALRIKRTLAQAFQHIESSLMQVRQIVERRGAGTIRTALGEDEAEVTALYRALKTLVEQNKPGATVPDLPA